MAVLPQARTESLLAEALAGLGVYAALALGLAVGSKLSEAMIGAEQGVGQ